MSKCMYPCKDQAEIDPARAPRVTQAFMKMGKFDLEALQNA